MDYWVTAGDAPAEILHATRLRPACRARCRILRRASGSASAAIRRRRSCSRSRGSTSCRGLPISVIIIDFFHWPNQGVWDFDKKYWPDPAAMVRELEGNGHPAVRLRMADGGSAQPVLRGDAREGLHRAHGPRRADDARVQRLRRSSTRRTPGRAFVWDKIKRSYYDCGIKKITGWMLPSREHPLPVRQLPLRGGARRAGGEYLPVRLRADGGDCLRAAGETGDPSRWSAARGRAASGFGTLVWSGDIVSDFETMRRQIVAGSIWRWRASHGGRPTSAACRQRSEDPRSASCWCAGSSTARSARCSACTACARRG